MSKNNTVDKGDKFEEQVFNFIKKILESEDFFVSGKKSKIFWKKGYYSEARKKDIIFDISIETYLNNNVENYSFLTIIECKDYEGAIPVDDVEEFDSKLSQIGEHNTKGIIFTKTAFQVGASNFAISKGIGLAIINSDNEIDWINYRKETNSSTTEITKSDSSRNSCRNFFAFVNNLTFDNLPSLLVSIGIIDKYIFKRNTIQIPFITPEQIEEKIQRLPTDRFYTEDKLITDDLCRFLLETFDVEFTFDESLGHHQKDKILGKITFKPLKIYLTRELKLNLYRWRFTLAHEIGHLLLHHEILKNYLDENIDVEKTLTLNGEFPEEANKNMEIQVNKFASILLLPQEPLLREVKKYFIEQNIHKGYLYLDHQRVNRTLLYNLLIRLKEKFEVSNEVAQYRLASLGLIQSKTMTSIKDVIQNI